MAGCVVALAAVAAVILYEVAHPTHRAASEGTAVAVPGQRTNILPDPDFLTACSTTQYDDSSSCVQTVLAAIDNARGQEGLLSMELPTNWASLTPAEQLFVAVNLERTARGLNPITGLSPDLNSAAAEGAQAGSDPPATAGGDLTTVGANWTQGYSNSLQAIYEWLYDDGLGSSNSDCTRQDLSGCWAHRANILLPLACTACAMGAAYEPADAAGDPFSYAVVLAESTTPLPLGFTWAQEQPYLH